MILIISTPLLGGCILSFIHARGQTGVSYGDVRTILEHDIGYHGNRMRVSVETLRSIKK